MFQISLKGIIDFFKIDYHSIRFKLFSALFLVIILFALINIFMVNQSLNNIHQYETVITNITAANSINGNVKQVIDYDLYQIIQGYLKFEDGKQTKTINDAFTTIENISTSVDTREAKVKLDLAKRTLLTVQESIQTLHTMMNENKDVAVLEIQLEQIRRNTTILNEKVGIFIAQQLMDSEQIKKEITSETSRRIILNFIIFVIALFSSTLFAIYLSNSVSRSIRNLSELSSRIANGDLTIERVSVESHSEIRMLSVSFNNMLESLKDIIINVLSSTEKVNMSSEQLQNSAEQNSSASQDIARSVQNMQEGIAIQENEVKDAIIEVNEMITIFLEAIEKSNLIKASAGNSVELSNSGNTYINNFIHQLGIISEAMNMASEVIKKFIGRTEEMTDIINTIGSIAEQTNLLALNASIEAARAGESGRGFAVVAEEIGKLADRSGGSAKQIVEMIHDLQEMSTDMNIKVNNGVEQVKIGEDVATKAKDFFKRLHEASIVVEKEIMLITESLNLFHKKIDGMNYTVLQMGKIADSNTLEIESISTAVMEQTANLEEVASSSQYLARLATEMEDCVKKFTINSNLKNS